MNKKNNGDIVDMIDEQAIQNSLINLFSTIRGKRRMLPMYALNIHNYLFEPLDEITALEIGNEILRSIEIWDDRVQVLDLLIEPNYDSNTYEISLTYKIKNFLNTQEYKTTLNKL
ncbi:MAG: hypothetical protein EOL95_10205 [Bacteroidia bacterium]|nr:hypothetical protein [Bacteroidia bacterium]